MKKLIALSLLCLLPTVGMQAQEPFSRGFDHNKKVFIPKGTVGTGFSFSFGGATLGNEFGYDVVPSLLEEVNGNYKSFSLAPMAGYFVADNVSVGARFNYSNLEMNLDKASLSLTDDLGFDVADIGFHRKSYLGSVFSRYYVPFLGSRIFGWFVEGGLVGGYSQNIKYRMEDGLKHGTYDDVYRIDFQINPGICFFVDENFDFEVQVGLVDIGYKRTQQVENQVVMSEGSKFGFSEKINLLAISFGAHIYILDKKHRQ